MRRKELTVGVLVIFLTWNVVTYLFIAYKQPGKEGEDRKDLEDQMALIQRRLKIQRQEQTKILKYLAETRKELMNAPRANEAAEAAAEAAPVQKGNATRSEKHAVDDKPAVSLDHNKGSVPLPVLVMACNRPSVSRNIDQLLSVRPSAEEFPIIVSQDCGHAQTAQTIAAYRDKLLHIKHPDLSDIALDKKDEKFKGYYMIARHYKWALNQVFHKLNYSAAIIVEDDLNISPDFFEYFSATFPILRADSSLWCVSAWNDNGKAGMVANNPELLHRTDFFPGLGWMLEKRTWIELEPKWPTTFWDDWMRHPTQRRDRACIRPEIPRTSTFGKIGVSKGQYYEKHLKFIEHNTKFVPFTKMDLSYLLKDNFDSVFVEAVYSATLVTLQQVLNKDLPNDGMAIRVEYVDKESFKRLAKALGIMDDLKAGVPRSGYRGVVSFTYHGRRVYLAPPSDWRGYDPAWN